MFRQCNGLYSLQIISNHIAEYDYYKEKPIIVNNLTNYRLCVLASGSLTADIFSCLILIIVSCLHFGQKSGKFSSIVSSRISNRVLLPQTGHNIQFVLSIWPPNAKCHVALDLSEQTTFNKDIYTKSYKNNWYGNMFASLYGIFYSWETGNPFAKKAP